jgi:polyisoprenoid-binding protein YceI
MHKLFSGIFFLLLSLSAFAEPETYTLDPSHSYVMWRVDHFGYSHQSGKWFANGTLILDQKNPQNSKANITISLADLVTGNSELNKHLNSALFFDAMTFPTAKFDSTKVVLEGKNKAKVTGIFTLHGISKPITLDAVLNKAGENPITNKPSVGFSASTHLKRSDYGMTSFIPGISDNVDIIIELEAAKSVEKK